MTALRALLFRQRRQAMWLVAMALLLKFLIPSGYMPALIDGGFLIQPCFGAAAPSLAESTFAFDFHADGHADSNDSDRQAASADHPCLFAGVAMPALSGADPILLAILLAAILAAIFRPQPILLRQRAAYLLPPSQGPPAHI